MVAGIATPIRSTTPGFSVVRRGYAEHNYGLAHELGHNMGADHDVHAGTSFTGHAPYSHGHVFEAAGKCWYTIMGYSTYCEREGYDRAGENRIRIGFYSTPRKNHPETGQALGIENAADNARTLTETASRVSQFSASTLPLPSGDPSTSVADEIACFLSPTPTPRPTPSPAPPPHRTPTPHPSPTPAPSWKTVIITSEWRRTSPQYQQSEYWGTACWSHDVLRPACASGGWCYGLPHLNWETPPIPTPFEFSGPPPVGQDYIERIAVRRQPTVYSHPYYSEQCHDAILQDCGDGTFACQNTGWKYQTITTHKVWAGH